MFSQQSHETLYMPQYPQRFVFVELFSRMHNMVPPSSPESMKIGEN